MTSHSESVHYTRERGIEGIKRGKRLKRAKGKESKREKKEKNLHATYVYQRLTAEHEIPAGQLKINACNKAEE